MKAQFEKYKNIIAIIVLVGVAFVGYSVFLKEDIDTSLLTSTQSTAEAEAVGAELLQLLATLRSIELDESLFDDPAFRSLEDFSQELAPEPVGRPNPFLPLGQTGASVPGRQQTGF